MQRFAFEVKGQMKRGGKILRKFLALPKPWLLLSLHALSSLRETRFCWQPMIFLENFRVLHKIKTP